MLRPDTVAANRKQTQTLESTAWLVLYCGGSSFGDLVSHTLYGKVFPFTALEVHLLQTKHIHTVSQILEVDDLTGRLTVDENRALLDDLAASPQLQYKLRLLAHPFCRALEADMFVTQTTVATSLFSLDKNLSQVFRAASPSQEDATPSILLDPPIRWDYPSSVVHLQGFLQSPSPYVTAFQN